MLLVLFVFLLVLFIILFAIHKKDILSPSVVMVLVYAFCVGFSFLNFDLWEMENYSKQASMIIVCSVLSFSFVGVFYEQLFYSRKCMISTTDAQATELVEKKCQIPSWFVFFNLMLCFVTDIWIYRASGRILTNRESINIAYPALLSLLIRYVNVQGFFFACVFARNAIIRGIKLKELLMLFFVFSACFISIVQGSRTTLLKIIGCIGISIYLSWRKKRGWRQNIKLKSIILCAAVFASFLFFFYFLKKFKIGNSDSFSILEYLSLYISAPIKLLELFVENPVDNQGIFGKETFVLINYNLAEMGLAESYPRHLEFRSLRNSIHLGNVYGAVRRYYSDFGLSGSIILSGVFSYVFHKMYARIKFSPTRSFDFPCVIYAYFFPCVLLFPIDDLFFSQLSIGMIADLLLLYFLYLLVLKQRIKIKFR